jgi:neuropilin 2
LLNTIKFESLFLLISLVNDTYEIGELNDINITTPSKPSWRLSNLSATTKYKFYLRACTSKGCGKPVTEESATLAEGSKYMGFLPAVTF